MNAERRAAELELLAVRLDEVREEAQNASAPEIARRIAILTRAVKYVAKQLRDFARTGPDCVIT